VKKSVKLTKLGFEKM